MVCRAGEFEHECGECGAPVDDGQEYCEGCLEDMDPEDDFDPRDFDDEDGRLIFADPGGRSALRAASETNPRNLPCPNCGVPNRLTPADQARGYQCDSCADRAEMGGY